MNIVNSEISIHRKRAGYYALWMGLLMVCIGAWWAWETPKVSGEAKLSVSLRVANMSEGTGISVWAGPKTAFVESAWVTPQRMERSEEQVKFEHSVKVAWRRWVKDYMPHHTDDLLVIRLQAAQDPPRYVLMDLEDDWHKGLLRIHGHMRLEIGCKYAKLPTDLQASLRALRQTHSPKS